MRLKLLFFSIAIKASLLLLAGCYKNHLYVQQEWVDAHFLASCHVGSPDPRSKNPPEGQRLLLSWKFPSDLFEEKLTFLITVRFWDNTQEILVKPIEKRSSSGAFYFPNNGDLLDRRILTYKIEVWNERGCLVEEWKHHFWRELIELHNESS